MSKKSEKSTKGFDLSSAMQIEVSNPVAEAVFSFAAGAFIRDSALRGEVSEQALEKLAHASFTAQKIFWKIEQDQKM